MDREYLRLWTRSRETPAQRSKVSKAKQKDIKYQQGIFVTGEALASKLVQNISNQTKPNCASIPNIRAEKIEMTLHLLRRKYYIEMEK